MSDSVLIAREELSPENIIYLKNLVARDYAVLKYYPNNDHHKDEDKIKDAEHILSVFDRMIQKYHTYQSDLSDFKHKK